MGTAYFTLQPQQMRVFNLHRWWRLWGIHRAIARGLQSFGWLKDQQFMFLNHSAGGILAIRQPISITEFEDVIRLERNARRIMQKAHKLLLVRMDQKEYTICVNFFDRYNYGTQDSISYSGSINNYKLGDFRLIPALPHFPVNLSRDYVQDMRLREFPLISGQYFILNYSQGHGFSTISEQMCLVQIVDSWWALFDFLKAQSLFRALSHYFITNGPYKSVVIRMQHRHCEGAFKEYHYSLNID